MPNCIQQVKANIKDSDCGRGGLLIVRTLRHLSLNESPQSQFTNRLVDGAEVLRCGGSMMSRNPADGNAGNSSGPQQPTEGYNQQFNGDNRGIANRGNLGSYNSISGGYSEQLNTARRYTLSAGGNDGNVSQQVPIHGSNDLMGNHSQRSHHSQQQMQGGNIGYRGDLRAADSPNNLNSMNHGYPYGAELSPTHLAHRMSLGYYPMSGGSAVSPNYGTLGDGMDLSGRGLPSASVPPSVGGAATQDEREEELLLQLLLARRQRGRAGDGKGRPQASLSDEIMQRFRQNRNIPGQRRSGSIPQLPGVPPLYTESMPASSGMVPPNMYPAMDNYGRSGGKGENFPSHFQMRQMQDITERIDRSPGHFQMPDARMSEMREFSERSAGFKRGMGSMGMGVMMVPGSGLGGMGYPPVKNPDFPYGVDMRETNQPAFKKKRTHKKKPSDMVRFA